MYLAKSASYPLTSQFSSKNPKGLESVFIPTFSVPRSRISSYKSASTYFSGFSRKKYIATRPKNSTDKVIASFFIR